ncbi:SufD family Fe-S cluster assembly protein, partial [Francisella tularensis subsp. holarctica]|uniref:SufD family Fe-S cluster assembly protein n=1 Tax=Francisella tularensis TaxID=263 RepID=UPI002381C0C0
AYRGLVRISPNAANARNCSQCDSLVIGHNCGAHTYPYIENKSNSSPIEHEATTSKISDEQLFYSKKRVLSEEDSIAMIVNGF